MPILMWHIPYSQFEFAQFFNVLQIRAHKVQSYQHRLGLLPGYDSPLICGFWRVSGQVLLYAAFVQWIAPDIAAVRVLRDDLILPLHC